MLQSSQRNMGPNGDSEVHYAAASEWICEEVGRQTVEADIERLTYGPAVSGAKRAPGVH